MTADIMKSGFENFTSFNNGCFPLCQKFQKFHSEFKWKGPFQFLSTRIFGITSGSGPLISVGIFRPKFAVPFLTNRFFALIREFAKGVKSGKSHSYWLARFNRKMLFHFPWVFPLTGQYSLTGRFGLMESTQCFPFIHVTTFVLLKISMNRELWRRKLLMEGLSKLHKND